MEWRSIGFDEESCAVVCVRALACCGLCIQLWDLTSYVCMVHTAYVVKFPVQSDILMMWDSASDFIGWLSINLLHLIILWTYIHLLCDYLPIFCVTSSDLVWFWQFQPMVILILLTRALRLRLMIIDFVQSNSSTLGIGTDFWQWVTWAINLFFTVHFVRVLMSCL